MKPLFDRIAVLGLGLLGGSVAMAARSRGVASCVAGAARRPDARNAALERGVVDEAGDFEAVVKDADLVVLATPVAAMATIARRVSPHLREGALVTDVGSVKGAVAETLPGVLPRSVTYVGAHPMAGSHETGLEHARADLLDGAPCVVTAGADATSVSRVRDFWSALGARVVLRSPEDHDAEVAWSSHAPHVLAFAFADALRNSPAGSLDVTGSGFRDFTRIAHSDPEMWSEILTANRKAIAAPLEAFTSALGEISRAIESGDADAVLRWLARAREALHPHTDPDRRPADGPTPTDPEN